MKFKFNLKKLLKDYGLSKINAIAIGAQTGVDRKIIGTILNNTKPRISLDELGKICTWLQEQGVPSKELPGRFFSAGSSDLWQELAKREGATICIGENYQKEQTPVGRFVSKRDLAVADRITKELSGQEESPQLSREYICCHLLDNYNPLENIFKQDIKRTKKIYRNVKAESSKGNTLILVGSQRANYLLEHFVADLFECNPFQLPEGQTRVPFFTVYRENDKKIPSCFGWEENPFARGGEVSVHGIHYQNEKRKWVICEWKEDENDQTSGLIIKDAGIVITVKDNITESIQIAVFGFSGRATEAIGQQLIIKTDKFWPPYVKVDGKEVGIYVCKLELLESKDKSIDGTIKTRDCDVVKLSEIILKEYLK